MSEAHILGCECQECMPGIGAQDEPLAGTCAYPLCPDEVMDAAETAAMAEYERVQDIPYGAPPGSLRWPWRAAAQVAWREGYRAGQGANDEAAAAPDAYPLGSVCREHDRPAIYCRQNPSALCAVSARATTCFCGFPEASGLVHRAHECVPWSSPKAEQEAGRV